MATLLSTITTSQKLLCLAYEHNNVLKEFEVVATKYNNISDDGFRKETFAKLRSILRAELESHKNDTDYEKCDIGYIQDAVDAMSQLRKFIRQNDTTAIENLIQSDPGLNINAGFGGSSYFKPIHLAAELGNVRVVETLIKHGAEINAKHNNTHLEYSPLHYAASEGNADVVRFLCKRGADINVEDVHGRTPIHMAVLYAKADAVRVLCKCGAEINAEDDHGRTTIHWAALYELAEVARILIKHGADINAKCLEGKTPLHYAAMSEIADVARILAEYGADINARCFEGKTPLHYAAMSGNADAVRVLCECGAEINIKDNDGKTPLDIADSDEVINILKEVEQKWPKSMGLAA
ncbi:putative ankyrin repeat protein RF_0381 [Sitodiplosis mosellana]|uniref:putative ankyrin repeat protein RF_0381 n=1 Tax=Sitodiplosis mosellana TaxID=263140 RepID=UPI002443FC05|nr:putative ankyrin repeat protein RF_0381 [Sitodiplosis mosellana]